MRLACSALLAALFSLDARAALPASPAVVVPAPAGCPADLGPWKAALGAEWLTCHRVADLTATGNPYTDTNSLTGMGSPPPGNGTLHCAPRATRTFVSTPGRDLVLCGRHLGWRIPDPPRDRDRRRRAPE